MKAQVKNNMSGLKQELKDQYKIVQKKVMWTRPIDHIGPPGLQNPFNKT